MKLTEEQRANYLTDGGNRCPHCDSGDLNGGPVEIDGNIAWQEVTCIDCDEAWIDLYKLFNVQDA